jgi:hypothetical protein
MLKDLQIDQSSIDTVTSMVSVQPGITLAELFDHAKGVSRDEIYFLIAHSIVFVDLKAAPLVEPDRCLVFRDEPTAEACLTDKTKKLENG